MAITTALILVYFASASMVIVSLTCSMYKRGWATKGDVARMLILSLAPLVNTCIAGLILGEYLTEWLEDGNIIWRRKNGDK